MVRIEVFLDESMFHAIPLSVPPSCDGLIPTLECSISVDTTGLTVTDPSGAVQPAHFLFGRMQSWGVGKGGSSIVIQMPRGPFTFSCEQSIQLVRKLTDISYMIHHAEHGHSGSHAAGAARDRRAAGAPPGQPPGEGLGSGAGAWPPPNRRRPTRPDDDERVGCSAASSSRPNARSGLRWLWSHE